MKRKNYSSLIRNVAYSLLFAVLGFLSDSAFSQGAAVNTSGAAADPSAMLDVSSNNSGILIPRMTEAQKNSINTPATGLMIYQTDGVSGFWYFDGSTWVQSLGATGATGATGSAGTAGLLPSGTSVGNTPYWDGTQWVVSSSNIFNNGGSIGINTSNPDGSAYLDVSGTSKGFLIPRMTTAERDLIGTPAQGLQIYNITTRCFEFFDYGIWHTLGCSSCPVPFAAGNISGNFVICKGQNSISFSVPAINNATNYIWEYSGQGVTINGNSNTVMLDFATNATSGNITVKGSNILCGEGQVSPAFYVSVISEPQPPAESSHTALQTQIIWNWNTVVGATGYKYNTVNDYMTAFDNSTNTSYTQLSANCATQYTLYVWAYNSCGESLVTSLNQSTTSCQWSCGSALSVSHTTGSVAPVAKSVNYGTVSSTLAGTGAKCWITQNLGSTNQATAVNDVSEPSAGWYWQYNRQQGHKHDGVTKIPVSWTSSITESSNWLAGNDPCTIELGSGWRLPTYTEYNNVISNGGWVNYNNAYNSELKLHAAGRIMDSGGSLSDIGGNGYYWSSNQYDSSNGWALRFYSTGSGMFSNRPKAFGFTIRCIKD